MFLQACVCPHGGCLPQCMLGYHTPGSRHPPQADTPREQTATAVDSTHPTGMYSCFQQRIQEPVKGGEKHEIYVAVFGGHPFYDLVLQGRRGTWPPPPDPLLILSYNTAYDWCRMNVLRKCYHKQSSLIFMKRSKINLSLPYSRFISRENILRKFPVKRNKFVRMNRYKGLGAASLASLYVFQSLHSERQPEETCEIFELRENQSLKRGREYMRRTKW